MASNGGQVPGRLSLALRRTNLLNYFDQQGLLKRLNYVVDIVGGGPAPVAHYCFEHHKVGGIIFPTYHRVLGRDPKAENQSPRPQWASMRISDIEIKEEIADDHTSNEKE